MHTSHWSGGAHNSAKSVLTGYPDNALDYVQLVYRIVQSLMSQIAVVFEMILYVYRFGAIRVVI